MSGAREIIGRHLVADVDGVDSAVLGDVALHRSVLEDALATTGHTVLDSSCHEFPGGGFTLVYLLAESHLSVHTYPERGYLAFDLFSCGGHDPRVVLDRLAEALGRPEVRARVIEREAARRPAGRRA